MTVAPHNFATKMGFYAMVHLEMAVPNWEMCEVDDAQFPALRADGVEVKNGAARLTGIPGLGVELITDQLRHAGRRPSVVVCWWRKIGQPGRRGRRRWRKRYNNQRR